MPAAGEQAQAHLGVLADAPLGPAPDMVDGGTAHQGHGAMLDDGVALVALDHADLEKAGIFPVDEFLEGVARPVVMVLRRLHEADVRAVEIRHQRLQPVRLDQIRSEEHKSELQSLMRSSYDVFCLNKKITKK